VARTSARLFAARTRSDERSRRVAFDRSHEHLVNAVMNMALPLDELFLFRAPSC
jgi:hypothetical protein